MCSAQRSLRSYAQTARKLSRRTDDPSSAVSKWVISPIANSTLTEASLCAPPLPQPVRERVQRIVLSTLRPEPVTEPQEFRLVDRRQDRRHRRLDNLVLQRGNAQRSTPPIRLRKIPSTGGQRSIPSPMHTCVKALEVCLQALLVLCPRQPIDPRRGVLLQSEELFARKTSTLT